MKSPFVAPLKAKRSWEGYIEPDADDLDAYMAYPFTRIEDAQGSTVFTAHDLFEFRPGHAEYIIEALSSYPALLELRDAVGALIKAKGRFHTEQNYAALVAAFDKVKEK